MRRADRELVKLEDIQMILHKCKTCHVAMVDNSVPYIVPLSYGFHFLDDGTLEIFFHSALEGRKLDMLKNNNNVCFEISYEGEPVHSETPCNSGYYFASVIGYGKVIFIEDPAEKCTALSVMFKHQSGKDVVFSKQQTAKICCYKIVSSNFTGKMKPKPSK